MWSRRRSPWRRSKLTLPNTTRCQEEEYGPITKGRRDGFALFVPIKEEGKRRCPIWSVQLISSSRFSERFSKAHLASAGISIDSLQDTNKPLIAIANSWNEVCPGHEPLRQLAAEVKKGVLEAGGEPIEFNTIAMCDGIAQGHAGMRYCLPHREIIADSCEAMIVGEGCFDGVVYLGSCDKISGNAHGCGTHQPSVCSGDLWTLL